VIYFLFFGEIETQKKSNKTSYFKTSYINKPLI